MFQLISKECPSLGFAGKFQASLLALVADGPEGRRPSHFELSISRVGQYTGELRDKHGVEIVDSLAALPRDGIILFK